MTPDSSRALPELLSGPLRISVEEYEAVDPDLQYAPVCRPASKGKGTFTALHYVDWMNPDRAYVSADCGQWHPSQCAAFARPSRRGSG